MAIEKTDHATGEWAMLWETDGDGRPDSYWCIEQDPDGYLCLTSNAATRERVDPRMYAGWDAEMLWSGLRRDGVPEEIIARYLEQAGL